MKPDPRPFMGTERVKFLNVSPKNCRKKGSSSKGKGTAVRLALVSTSMFTTAGEVFFTMGTTGDMAAALGTA